MAHGRHLIIFVSLLSKIIVARITHVILTKSHELNLSAINVLILLIEKQEKLNGLLKLSQLIRQA